jgi:hypothetical protein
LVPPPESGVIPVTKGCDRAFTIQRVNEAGSPVSFDAGVEVYIWVDVDPTPIKVNAVVSGSNASFTIQSAVCDVVKNNTRWRAVLDSGDLETPLLVGRFERRDG